MGTQKQGNHQASKGKIIRHGMYNNSEQQYRQYEKRRISNSIDESGSKEQGENGEDVHDTAQSCGNPPSIPGTPLSRAVMVNRTGNGDF